VEKGANRNVRAFGGGDEPTRPVSRRLPPVSLSRMLARTEGYTYDANVWDLSIVHGPFSVAPCQTFTNGTIRNFSIAVCRARPAGCSRTGTAVFWSTTRCRQGSSTPTHTRTGVCRPPAREPRQRRRRAAGHHARHGTSSLSLSLPLSLPLPLSPSLSPSLTRTHAPGCAGRQRVSPASAAAVLLATTRGTAPGGAPPPRCALR
jgi:hypothetical protein